MRLRSCYNPDDFRTAIRRLSGNEMMENPYESPKSDLLPSRRESKESKESEKGISDIVAEIAILMLGASFSLAMVSMLSLFLGVLSGLMGHKQCRELADLTYLLALFSIVFWSILLFLSWVLSAFD